LDRADGARLVGVYLVLTAVGVGIGLLLTRPFRDSAVVRTDRAIAEWFADNRTGTLNALTAVGSQLSDTMVKIPVTALICVVVFVAWRRWLEPLTVAVPLIVEATAFITITFIVRRPRPDVPRLESSPVDSSFPSGHTAAAVVYATVVVVIFWHTRSRWIRVLAIAAVTFISIAVGLSRMQRGMHFLSDVVFGAVLGAATVIVVTAILTRADRRRVGPPEVGSVTRRPAGTPRGRSQRGAQWMQVRAVGSESSRSSAIGSPQPAQQTWPARRTPASAWSSASRSSRAWASSAVSWARS
jgi:undecaprenyl-diphosphatase